MSILVTGGAGYIGSHLVKVLNNLNQDLVVIDNLYNGFQASIGENNFVEGDISDEKLIKNGCSSNGVDRVFHFAPLLCLHRRWTCRTPSPI
jgi:UDP-glucose 4-epimerase